MSTRTPAHPGGTLRLRSRERIASRPSPEQVDAVQPDPAEIAALKQANVQREREAHEAAVIRRRQQTREVLALLRAGYGVIAIAARELAVGRRSIDSLPF